MGHCALVRRGRSARDVEEDGRINRSLACESFGDDEEDVTLIADFVNNRDVRVLDRGDHARPSHRRFARVGVVDSDEKDRDVARTRIVLGRRHGAIAGAAERGDDSVAADASGQGGDVRVARGFASIRGHEGRLVPFGFGWRVLFSPYTMRTRC